MLELKGVVANLCDAALAYRDLNEANMQTVASATNCMQVSTLGFGAVRLGYSIIGPPTLLTRLLVGHWASSLCGW